MIGYPTITEIKRKVKENVVHLMKINNNHFGQSKIK